MKNYKTLLVIIILFIFILCLYDKIIFLFNFLYYIFTKKNYIEYNKLSIEKKYNNIIIPKKLYFCCKNKNKIPSYVLDTWQKLNPNYLIKIYDDNECIKFLKKEYGQLYVDIFNYIKDGPVKADFWRICILYKKGGVYSDIDIEPLVPLDDLIVPNISFLTCKDNLYNILNPHIIICNKNHFILKNCIEIYINLYKNKIKYNYWSWSIVFIMTYVINIYIKNIKNDSINFDIYNNMYQILKENITINPKNINCSYKNIKLLNNRYKSYDYIKHTF
jgi:mannosyltransferase OCH1-like enzyme